MAARFLQRYPPGTPVAGVGFVKPGEVFTAPEGFIPSKLGAHLPCNKEAQDLIKKHHPKLELAIVELTETETPKKAPSGLTMKELDELNRGGDAPAGEPQKPAAKGGERKL